MRGGNPQKLGWALPTELAISISAICYDKIVTIKKHSYDENKNNVTIEMCYDKIIFGVTIKRFFVTIQCVQGHCGTSVTIKSVECPPS